MRFLLIYSLLISKMLFAQKLNGAWVNVDPAGIETFILATKSFVAVSTYDTKTHAFLETFGGNYEISNTDEMVLSMQFHSKNASLIGAVQSYNLEVNKKSLTFNDKKFTPISEKKSNALTGLWRITHILREGQMTEIKTGPRKTLKLMAGGYFQWIAINTNTFEFFGTGGGKYTLVHNVYTEEIRFFSRDASRVGAKLSFEAKVTDKTWEHSGKNSKGEPLKEVWTKLD